MDNKKWKKKLDKQFSEYIRKRDKFKCKKCGKVTKYVACAHIYSRNNMSTRWDPDNAIALCFYCHIQWAHHNPLEFAEWVKKKLGKRKFDKLYKKALRTVHADEPYFKKVQKELDNL